MIDKILKNKNGTTLLEMVVAIAIFLVAILAATGIFNMALEAQRSAVAAQNLQESMRYALEIMAKEIRGADLKLMVGCSGKDAVYCKKNRPITNYPSLEFTRDSHFVSFWLQNNRIYYEYTSVFGEEPITPASVKVNSFNFIISDDGVVGKQPKVTITMEVEAVGKQAHKQKINIQTTISSRYYE